MDTVKLDTIATRIRSMILKSTNAADSGHPTSSLSAVELMTALMFGGVFRYAADNPAHPNNDRLIFSKGHASPLFYALWAAADQITEEELLTYRQSGSRLEGHPAMTFPFTEAATGSLGQGLSIGLGMALNGKYLDKLPYRTFVLLGDSEMAEGSQWEAIQLAAHYELDNLIGILDVNRLGQCGETLYGHDIAAYRDRIAAFGWETIVVADGHSLPGVLDAYAAALSVNDRPTMVIAKTVKGKGVPSVEDRNGYHGKSLGPDALREAAELWGELDPTVCGAIAAPDDLRPEERTGGAVGDLAYALGDRVATRDAYGNALNRIFPKFPELVALDGEVSNSTRAEVFRDKHPDRFFEMYVAEQNMVSAAVGLSRRGKRPFVSSFAAFLTRAFDQIRMGRYSEASITFVGSHAGTSIGQDGPSQMGLEDIAMFRTLLDSVVLYPSDAVAAEKLVEAVAEYQGISYLRMTRSKTPVLYDVGEAFPIGGSKIPRQSDGDTVSIVTAGYTLHEALNAARTLHEENIAVRVIDLYSIKPIDQDTLEKAACETGRILVVEDHFAEGGIGDAVFAALRGQAVQFRHLAVTEKPGSGAAEDNLAAQHLNSDAIVREIRAFIQ